MSQVNLSSFSNAAAAAANQDSAIVVESGAGRARVDDGSHLKSTHRASMDAFVDSVETQYGRHAAEQARNLLGENYAQGKPLQARNVTQIVREVRADLGREFCSKKNSSGQTALDRAIAAMPQARNMSPEHKALIKDYVTNMLKDDLVPFTSREELHGMVCGLSNSLDESSAGWKVEHRKAPLLPGLDALVDILCNKGHPVNMILDKLPDMTHDKKEEALVDMSRLLRMIATPMAPPAGIVYQDENMVACLLARALPSICGPQPEGAPATERERAWLAAVGSPMPREMLSAAPEQLNKAFAAAMTQRVDKDAAELMSKDPKAHAVERGLREALAAFSFEQLAQARLGGGLRASAPTLRLAPDSYPGLPLAQQFSRALGDMGRMDRFFSGGISLVVQDGTGGSRDWRMRYGEAGGARRTGGEGLTAGNEEVVDALRSVLSGIHGPGADESNSPAYAAQSLALIGCLGQTGTNLLRSLATSVGVNTTTRGFAHDVGVSPGLNGSVELRLRMSNPRDTAHPQRAEITITVSKEGGVSLSNLDIETRSEAEMAAAAFSDRLKIVAGMEREAQAPALMSLIRDAGERLNRDGAESAELMRACVNKLGDEQIRQLSDLLNRPVMGETLALLEESGSFSAKTGRSNLPPEIKAAYDNILRERGVITADTQRARACLTALAGALKTQPAPPTAGASWSANPDVSAEARAAAEAIAPSPISFYTRHMAVLVQAEDSGNILRNDAVGTTADMSSAVRMAMVNSGVRASTATFFRGHGSRIEQACAGMNASEKQAACATASQAAARYLAGVQGPLTPLAAIYVELFNGLLDKLNTTPALKSVYTQVVMPMLAAARQGLSEARDHMAGGIGAQVRSSAFNAPDSSMRNLATTLCSLRLSGAFMPSEGENLNPEQVEQKELMSQVHKMFSTLMNEGGGSPETLGRLDALMPGFSALLAPLNSSEAVLRAAGTADIISMSRATDAQQARAVLGRLESSFNAVQASGGDGRAFLRDILREAAVSSAPAALPSMREPGNALRSMVGGMAGPGTPLRDALFSGGGVAGRFAREVLTPLLSEPFSHTDNMRSLLADLPPESTSANAQRAALGLGRDVYCDTERHYPGLNESIRAFLPALNEGIGRTVEEDINNYLNTLTRENDGPIQDVNAPAWKLTGQFASGSHDYYRGMIDMDGRFYTNRGAAAGGTETSAEEFIGLFPNRRAAALLSAVAHQGLPGTMLDLGLASDNERIHDFTFISVGMTEPPLVGTRVHIETLDAEAGRYRIGFISTKIRNEAVIADGAIEEHHMRSNTYTCSMEITLGDKPRVSNVKTDILVLGTDSAQAEAR